jgi:hypothetical protein
MDGVAYSRATTLIVEAGQPARPDEGRITKAADEHARSAIGGATPSTPDRSWHPGPHPPVRVYMALSSPAG